MQRRTSPSALTADRVPATPLPRGPLSAQLLYVLDEHPTPAPQLAEAARRLVAASPDP